MDKSVKKHILVISQYFYPEQFRINDICSEWVKRGYKVTVITGIPNYPQGKFFNGYGIFKKQRELYNGIEIIRIPILPRGKSAITLALNYISFVVSGFFWQIFTKINADIVFIYEVSPMTQALPGVWYAKKKSIPCYLYVTDLWPENVEYSGRISNNFVIQAIGLMVEYIYKRSSKILTSSESFISAITKRNIERSKIEFWPQYAEDFYSDFKVEVVNIKEIPNDGVLNVTFAGNIGYSQGLDVLVDVAKILKDENLIVRFNIVGNGRYKNTLMLKIKENNVTQYFNFINSVPAIKIPEFMALSDATLICLSKSDVLAMTLPAKTQSCLASGIPIIASADGEVCEVILKAQAGLCSDAGDAKKLSENIKKLSNLSISERKKMGDNGLKYYKENFDKTLLLNKIDELFKEALR